MIKLKEWGRTKTQMAETFPTQVPVFFLQKITHFPLVKGTNSRKVITTVLSSLSALSKFDFASFNMLLNKSIKINKLPVAGNPILVLLGFYISVATTDFLLDGVILLESLDLHSGSNANSIYTGLIDL